MRDASTQVDGVSRRRNLGFGTETQTPKDPVEEEEDGDGSRWSYPLRWKKDGVELGGGGEGFGRLGSAEVDEVTLAQPARREMTRVAARKTCSFLTLS